MFFSIIIATLNRGIDLSETIKSINGQLNHLDEVIIIDQTDIYEIEIENDIKKNINNFSGNILRIFIKEKSAGKARNIGIKNAKNDNIIFIDDDVILPPNFLENYRKYLTININVDAIAGRVSSSENDINPYLPKEFNDKNVGFLFRPMNYEFKLENADLGSCNMFIKKEVFNKLKGFDEKMKRLEDSDLSCRFQKAGFKSIYLPEIWLVHKATPTGASRHITIQKKPYPNYLFWKEYFYFTLKNFGIKKGHVFITYWLKQKLNNKRTLLLPWNLTHAIYNLIKGYASAKSRLRVYE